MTVTKEMHIALVGASKNEEKFGFKVLQYLLDNNFTVTPINPKETEILNQQVYPNLVSVTTVVDLVVTVVPPSVTNEIVKEAKAQGISRIWMQPGSESEEAIEFCNKNGIEVVSNACIMMQNYNS